MLKELEPRTVVLGSAPREGEPGRRALATFLDGRWLRDGRIAALDNFGLPIKFTMNGEPYGEPKLPPNPWRMDAGVISEGTGDYVSLSDHRVTVYGSDQHYRWDLTQAGIGTPTTHRVELSHDGNKLALGVTQHGIDPEDEHQPRFGWWVLDVTKRPNHLGSWNATILAHGLGEATGFAFDRGERMLIATSKGAGVVRLDGEQVAVTGDVASCVALDDRGVRAVFGFAHCELRIDYLSPKRKGLALVEVVDSQRIDAGVVPVALALDPEGTRIACVAADGRVEIVPVP